MLNKIPQIIVILCLVCFGAQAEFKATKTAEHINIDGYAVEQAWSNATWYPINQLILGEKPSKSDFDGRFKLLWDESAIYLQAEIVDDVLFDQHADPKYFYWDDDCLEVFIDEDLSGGNHQHNYNAFAYHVALDNQAVDIGEKLKDGSPNFVLLNEHIKSYWKRSSDAPHKIIWELAITIHNDKFNPAADSQKSLVTLTEGKQLGFMLAYCDNDGSKHRESFIGSTYIEPINGDKNLGYITADVFDKLILDGK